PAPGADLGPAGAARNKLAPPGEWLALADGFYEASLARSPGGARPAAHPPHRGDHRARGAGHRARLGVFPHGRRGATGSPTRTMASFSRRPDPPHPRPPPPRRDRSSTPSRG